MSGQGRPIARPSTAGDILRALCGAATLAAGAFLVGNGTSQLVSTDTALTFSGGVFQVAGSVPGTPSAGKTIIGGGAIKAYGEISCDDGLLRTRIYPANVQLHRTGAASYTDITGIGGTYVIRTSNAASLDTTALTIAANGAATFGAGITCTTLTASGGTTPGAATSGQTLIGNGSIRAYGNIHSETGSFLLASGGAIYAGGNLAAAFYSSAPGTPGANDVFVGGGQIKTGTGLIVATDPGGSERVRIGGGIKALGAPSWFGASSTDTIGLTGRSIQSYNAGTADAHWYVSDDINTSSAIRVGVASGTTPKIAFLGTAAIARQTSAAAATDAATTQTLANSLRTILINLGLAS